MSFLLSRVMPWQSRRKRREDIARIQVARRASERRLASARREVAELEGIVYRDNHFAESVMSQLRPRAYRGER